MNSIISRKEEFLFDYSDTIFSVFKREKYGIQCGPMGNLLRKKALRDTVQWQSDLEDNLTIFGDITLISRLPILDSPVPFTIGGLNQKTKTTVTYKYILGHNDSVVIDNDGCQTNIIITPGEGDTHAVFTQGSPSLVWTIVHNLGYSPNVRTEDLSGANIHGVVADDSLDPLNKLTITFSTALAGKAFLS